MEDKLDKGKTCQKQASLSEINFLPRLKAELHGYLFLPPVRVSENKRFSNCLRLGVSSYCLIKSLPNQRIPRINFT